MQVTELFLNNSWNCFRNICLKQYNSTESQCWKLARGEVWWVLGEYYHYSLSFDHKLWNMNLETKFIIHDEMIRIQCSWVYILNSMGSIQYCLEKCYDTWVTISVWWYQVSWVSGSTSVTGNLELWRQMKHSNEHADLHA